MTDEGDAIVTAEQFARDVEATAAQREYDLRVREENHRHGRALAVVWAPVVAVVLLGAMAFLAFVVYQVSGEHAAEHQAELDAQHRQVTVWCYADPNSDRGTSTVTGTPDQVQGFCPDARVPVYGGGNP